MYRRILYLRCFSVPLPYASDVQRRSQSYMEVDRLLLGRILKNLLEPVITEPGVIHIRTYLCTYL